MTSDSAQWRLMQVADHGQVFRIALGSPANRKSAVLKLTIQWEAQVIRCLVAELPHTVPALYDDSAELGCPAKDSVGLLLEDLTPADQEGGPPDPVEQAAAFQAGIPVLATVHDHFEGDVDRLSPPRAVVDLPQAAVLEVPGLLHLLTTLGLPLDATALTELDAIGARVAEHVDRLLSAGTQTLVHGDFHTANIMFGKPQGEARIVDWGRSGAGPPEWDLVLCGEAEICLYLTSRRAISGQETDLGSFGSRLRSAVIVRMYEFICAIVNLVFGPGAENTNLASAQPLLNSLPMYLDRLVLAAMSESFLGGKPLYSQSHSGSVR